MCNQLSRSNLPNTDFTFSSSRDNEFMVMTEADAGDSILVSVIDLPELCIIVYSEGTDLSIRPSGKNNLISEN